MQQGYTILRKTLDPEPVSALTLTLMDSWTHGLMDPEPVSALTLTLTLTLTLMAV